MNLLWVCKPCLTKIILKNANLTMNMIFSFKWLKYLEIKTLIGFNCSLIGFSLKGLKLILVKVISY